jgi:hypothetical protein
VRYFDVLVLGKCSSVIADFLARSSTVSISSSLYHPIWEYGRSYHRYRSGSEYMAKGDAWLCFADKEIEYMLPNDEVCPSCIS